MLRRNAALLCLSLACAFQTFSGGLSFAADSPQIVKITAKKFTFSPDTFTVKKNVPVVLQLSSADRRHGIAIPALNLRSDINPNGVAELKFTPQKAGEIKFYCDVQCGDGHDGMEGSFKVTD